MLNVICFLLYYVISLINVKNKCNYQRLPYPKNDYAMRKILFRVLPYKYANQNSRYFWIYEYAHLCSEDSDILGVPTYDSSYHYIFIRGIRPFQFFEIKRYKTNLYYRAGWPRPRGSLTTAPVLLRLIYNSQNSQENKICISQIHTFKV